MKKIIMLVVIGAAVIAVSKISGNGNLDSGSILAGAWGFIHTVTNQLATIMEQAWNTVFTPKAS